MFRLTLRHLSEAVNETLVPALKPNPNISKNNTSLFLFSTLLSLIIKVLIMLIGELIRFSYAVTIGEFLK